MEGMENKRSSRTALAENFALLTKGQGSAGPLAKKLKIGNSTVQRLQAGETVQLDTLETIADAYNIEVHRLLLPNLGATTPLSDLSPQEVTLITLFRLIKSEADRLALITKANSFAADGSGSPSPSDPYSGKKPPKSAYAEDSGAMPLDPPTSRTKAPR